MWNYRTCKDGAVTANIQGKDNIYSFLHTQYALSLTLTLTLTLLSPTSFFKE